MLKAPRCWAVSGVLLLLLAGRAGGVCLAQIFTRTDPEAEVRLGREVAALIEREVGLCSDPTVVSRVARIGRRVSEQMEQKAYTYEFRVAAVEDINAFSLPGGIVFLTEGLVGHIPSDDALAFVIGHEIAHAAKRHWASLVKKSEGVGLLAGLLGAAVGASAGLDLGSLAADLAHALMMASYSRDQEREADAVGLELMWRAHFDPRGAVQAMQMLKDLGQGGKAPKYLSTHPPIDERVKRLEKLGADLAGREPPPLKPLAEAAPAGDQVLPSVGDMTGIEVAGNDWYPLAVGNEWCYEVAGATGLRTTYTLRVVSALPGPSGTVYRMEWVPQQGQPRCSQVVTTSSALWLRPRPEARDGAWTLEMFLPPVPEEPVSHGGWNYCAAGAETITTPCGRFEATVIKKWGGEPVKTYLIWLVRGVGMVRRVCQEQNVTETLISYRAKPPAQEGESQEVAPAGGEAEGQPGGTAATEESSPENSGIGEQAAGAGEVQEAPHEVPDVSK